MLVITVVLLIVGLLLKDDDGKNFFRVPNKELIRRFFQRAIGGDRFTIALLLFFLIHLALIYNNVNDAFNHVNASNVFARAINVIVYLTAIFISLFLYPQSSCNKPAGKRRLMVSGLSSGIDEKGNNVINYRNIDLLIAPIVSGEFLGLEKLVVIPSSNIASFKMDERPYAKLLFTEGCKMYGKTFTDTTYSELCKEINNGQLFDLKKVILKFMPYLKDGIDLTKIEIVVKSGVDYDSFPDCVDMIGGVLKNEELKQGSNDTLLYINPGTGVIGSALSAFALPGSRFIVYAPQIDRTKDIQVFDVEPKSIDSIYSEIANKNK